MRIDAWDADGRVDSSLPLKEFFPFLTFWTKRFRFRSLLRWGGGLSAVILLLLCPAFSGHSGIQAYLIIMAVFGGCCFSCTFFTGDGDFSTGEPKFAYWGILRCDDGVLITFRSPNRLSSEQEMFLVELEKQLKEYSRGETVFKSCTCTWNPDAFETLKRLFDEGVLSPEEFTRFKRERIEQVIPVRE